MNRERRNVLVLAVCQAMFQSASVLIMTLSGLVGQRLADDPALATLPIAATVVGTAIATIPASLLMGRVGRRPGFILGALIGAAGGALSALAVGIADFALFCFGNLLVGVYQGFAQFYRFAAAEAARPESRGRAISLVLAGGVVAAVAGPEIAKWTRDLGAVAYMAPYLAVAALGAVPAVLLLALALPTAGAEAASAGSRPLVRIARQPAFVVAVTSAAIGYGVMILAMTATPLAMVAHHHGVDTAAFVIQGHVLGMFLPSFVTGTLIQRLGVLTIMSAGVALLALHVAIAVSGIDVPHFLSALVLLGVGWNFLFVGGTTLLTATYEPAERAKVQALNDFLILAVVVGASFSSGALLNAFGWRGVNLVALPFLAASGLAIGWLGFRRRRLAAT
jgi:predicted MFS family arabinose efflux permease